MKLYRYIVAHDTGFAPNPFHECCTLATCKPKIRQSAQTGDWVMGLGSAQAGLSGRLVFAMHVSEKLTFDEYWQDPRFQAKKPRKSSKYEERCGDNVYRRDMAAGTWIQEPCFHCDENLVVDTDVDWMLVGDEFVYYGASAIELPVEFLAQGQRFFCGFRNHQVHNLPTRLQHDVIEWLESLCRAGGRLGDPAQQGRIVETAEEMASC